jgi:superfamily II DNA/RNA helicase
MNKPVTHSVDSATEAPIEMSHHVLHVSGTDRMGVLVELLAAPGRSVVFTRTKRRAKVLTRQLIQAGVPAVELHGNLAQNARNRNLAAFSDGSAETLVATDIAARGIHVDDVALVIHADPPVEHKAYLHRSGRTARAGAQGTVITLMADDQQAEVRDLTRKAGVRPTVSRTRPGDPLLATLAPGERKLVTPSAVPAQAMSDDNGNGGGRPARSRPRGHTAEPASGRSGGARREPAAGQGGGGRSRGAGGGARGAGSGAARGAGGGGRGRSGGSGSAAVHTSQTPGQGRPAAAGSAAAFSSGTRVGGRRSGR